MSLIYHGKLVSPDHRAQGKSTTRSKYEGGSSGQSRQALKVLSKQEKLLLLELQRTRRRITDELSNFNATENISNILSKDSFGETNSGNTASISKKRGDTNDVSRKMSKSSGLNSLIAPVESIQLFSKSMKNRPLDKTLKNQGTYKLPLFVLPAIKSPNLSSSLSSSSSTTTTSKDIDYFSNINNRKKKKESSAVDAMNLPFNFKWKEGKETTMMVPINTLVFISKWSNIPLQTLKSFSVSNELTEIIPLKKITNNNSSTFMQVCTDMLNNCIEIERFTTSGTKSSSKSSKNSISSKKKLLQEQNKLPSSSSLVINLEKNELEGKLMESLISMKDHTSHVKNSILHMGRIMDGTSSNNMARRVIVVMAAEKMALSVYKILIREKKKGFLAWLQMIQDSKYYDMRKKFNKFILNQRLVQMLRKSFITIINKKFQKWKVITERIRSEAEYQIKYSNAQNIQCIWRGVLARIKFAHARETNKYVKLYDSCIKLQALLRGKRTRWRHLHYLQTKLELSACKTMQRVIRGYISRYRVHVLKRNFFKNHSSIKIQSTIRMKLATIVVREKQFQKYKQLCAIKISKIIRGFLARCRVRHIHKEKQKIVAVIQIQKVWKGGVVRMTLQRRMEEMEEEKDFRNKCAIKIQSVIRGFRGRLYYKILAVEFFRRKRITENAATKIINMVRGFMARVLYTRMKKEQLDAYITIAILWKETWSDDSDMWYYINEETQEAIWEPNKGGYTKSDGRLVLGNGEIIDNPATAGMESAIEIAKSRICSECNDRVAIRACVECSDRFCTPCYKATHQTGTRKDHKWTSVGPRDCSECEEELAERWCVSCDEAYCDVCWKRVHSKGKRRYHPFCELDKDGNMPNTTMFTIDGEEVENYDPSYPRKRWESEHPEDVGAIDYSQYSQTVLTGGIETDYNNDYNIGYGEGYEESVQEEWTEAWDVENQTSYWYNSYTGISQYENPWEGY